MHTLLTIITFILILAVLVLAHEFGHFIVAKKSGMEVEEFGFGFPPRLWGRRKGGTLYSINLIPIGGFVKIVGENNDSESNPKSFINKSFLARFGTLIAGVVMNFILAWVLFAVGFGIGLPTVVQQGEQLPAHAQLHSEKITVLQVVKDSPAAASGLREGDSIAALDGNHFSNIQDLIAYIHSHIGKSVAVQLQRGSEQLNVEVYARPNAPADQGAMGIALGEVGRLSFPWYLTPVVGFKATIQVIQQTAVGFYEIFAHGKGVADLGGPVKIASLTGQAAQLGIVYVLQFAAFLSVNLGILNIIPFPALDGGRILFLVIEKVRGKRNNEVVERWFNTIGFALLILLILFVTVKDVTGLMR